VRMNTASEKVLRRRSARGPTLLYDLRFRRNTVHCVAKFGSLLGLHALKTPLPGVDMFSCTYKWTLRRVKSRHSLILQDTRGGDEQSAQDCRIMFPSEGSTGRSRPAWARRCLSFRLFR
jgi:hypothetical protein